MRELSVFADESGDKSNHSRYFLLTVVLHDQSDEIVEKVLAYERSLALADLPNIPFHSEPLLNGHEGYESLDIKDRKKLLYSFNILVQRPPGKRTTMTEYRLAQVADYLCTIELAAVKYAAKEDGGTYDKFFGGIGAFKKNWLKQARRKAIG